MSDASDRLLLEATFAAMRKSGVVWVDGRATWLLWHDGAVHVVSGGSEQVLGIAPGQSVQVVVPSPTSRARQLVLTADVSLVTGEARVEAVRLLVDKRLNLDDPKTAAARWGDVDVLRLTPRLPLDETPAVADQPATLRA